MCHKLVDSIEDRSLYLIIQDQKRTSWDKNRLRTLGNSSSNYIPFGLRPPAKAKDLKKVINKYQYGNDPFSPLLNNADKNARFDDPAMVNPL